jgi:flagellar M-ring protein FliF
VEKFLKQLQAFVAGLSLQQKVLLGGGVLLVVAVLAVFVKLTEKADFKVLYSGLAPQDAQSVVQSLSVKNIAYQLSTDGTSVSVPADQLDKVRMQLAAEGMPQTGRLGFEIFDKPNWAGSDFSEQVNYQRALEGELERTIQTMGNVQSVRVHIVLPHESLFTDQERVAKAAVVLKLRGGGLTEDQINAVTRLVASAVDNLSPENVTLIGADGRTPIVAKGHDGMKGGGDGVELEAALAEKVVATLTPIVGQDHVKASVTIAYDQSSGDTTQETYDPANPVLVSSQVQEERFGGMPPAGIPGTPSNTPNASAANANASNVANAANGANAANAKPATPQGNPPNPLVATSSESEGQTSESKTYDVSRTVRHTVDPAGRIQKIAAAVLVDDAIEDQKDAKGNITHVHRKRTPDEMKQIEDLAKAAIGFDATRGDVLSVQNAPFLVTPYEAPAPPPIVDRVRVQIENWVWLVRYAVLLALFALIYMLVLKPVKDQLMKSFQLKAVAPPALATGGQAGVGAGLPVGNLGELAGGDLEKALNQTGTEVQRVVQMKKQLADKVRQDPVAASQLVRHWMNEEKRK